MKNKFFTIILGALILIVLVSAGWFRVFSKIYSERQEIRELRKKLLLNDKKNNDEKSFIRFFDSVKTERNLVESVFLRGDNLIDFIKEIESIGERSGVAWRINSISTVKDASSKPVVSLDAEGNFEQLFTYLYFLENIPYIITIEKVSFQNIEVGDNVMRIDNKKIGSMPVWRASFIIKLESYEN